jgi:RsiW-degrading membrane proteinase PrsW (M82 family)
MNIIIQRNGQKYGPYDEITALQYLKQGHLFPSDLAQDVSAGNTANWLTLEKLLASPVSGSAGVVGQTLSGLKSFDIRVIFPLNEITSLRWIRDRKLINLATIGLAPAIALAIAPGVSIAYWAIAFYFSSIWALFFYYLFRTPQVAPKLCFVCFFFTGIISIAVLLILQNIPPWSLLYPLTDSQNFITRALGMFFAVGISEEICKAAIVFLVARRPGNILAPQTVVFYGMISGLGFGIYEGVAYQQNINRAQGVDTAYFLNIARLTSLPFLHAIWTGISCYFISFSVIFPKKRFALWVIAIGIPAALHAIYNTFGWSFIGLGTGLVSVIILMTYLSNCNQMYNHLGKS